MGGHGALNAALKIPGRYRSVSALAPICAPMQTDWTQHAFERYLGMDRKTWKSYDTCELLAGGARFGGTILVDQGEMDPMIGALRPDLLSEVCARTGQALNLRMRPGYNHNYFFVSSFVEDHLRHHARHLCIRA